MTPDQKAYITEMLNAREGQHLARASFYASMGQRDRVVKEQLLQAELIKTRDAFEALFDAHPERLCKGSVALGTGCGKCSRCRAEVQPPDHVQLVRELNVVVNGAHRAAERASLRDIVTQLRDAEALFNRDELDLLRQWYHAVLDLNPEYLNRDGLQDAALYHRICGRLGVTPHGGQTDG